MRVCALQLERGEKRELAPVKGAIGAMTLSGGSITKIEYCVFDTEADKLDLRIRKEPWRAFSRVCMWVTVDKDPEFEVEVDGSRVPVRACHKTPGQALLQHLATYFPLIPKTYQGRTYNPEAAS